MRIPAAESPASALRGALVSPWPELRATAARIVRRAMRDNETLREAAAALGVDERALRRLRTEFPELEREK